MIYIILNIVPILAATFASLAFGFVMTKVSNGARHSVGFYIAAFVAEFWLCSILAGALILAPPQAGEWVMALGSAVVIWIGFVVPALVVSLGHRGESAGRIARDCGHWLVAMFLMALVLKTIGLVPPPGAPGMSG